MTQMTDVASMPPALGLAGPLSNGHGHPHAHTDASDPTSSPSAQLNSQNQNQPSIQPDLHTSGYPYAQPQYPSISTPNNHLPLNAQALPLAAPFNPLHRPLHYLPPGHAPTPAHALQNPSLLLSFGAFGPNFGSLLGPTFEGLGDVFDLESMKRTLDTSNLPANPFNGLQPTIDPTNSFDATSQQKRPRHSPAPFPNNAGTPSAIPRAFVPGQPFMPLGFNGQPHSPAAPPSLLQMSQNGLQTPMSAASSTMPMSPFMANQMVPMSPYMQFNGPMSPIMSPSMNPNTMTGNYGPAAAAAAAAAAGNITGRTVYVGNLPENASVDELLNLVRFGPIENVKLLPEKACVFISFLDGSTSAAFHADASVKKLALHGQELKIGWGKPSQLPANIAMAVHHAQATRNVFVGNLDPNDNEEKLRNELGQFGPIDQIKIVRDKNIGFVHFLSISTAMKVVSQLPSVPGWEDKRVNYGKDRCAYVPKAQQAAVQAAQAQAAAAISSQQAQMTGSPYVPFSPGGFNYTTPAQTFSPVFGNNNYPGSAFAEPGNTSPGNRTVYLGNIAPDTTTEELCNSVRGGIIQQIRHLQDKNIAFVTFVDSQAAAQFHQHANTTHLTLNQRRLKVGWGKPPGPLPANLLQAVQAGASRNVYLGGIHDFETFNEEKLRADFSTFGEIEMINFLKEKFAAFINFTQIQSAQKAVDTIKTTKEEYAALRISYGKDRCANPPRSNNTGATPMRATPMRQTLQITPPEQQSPVGGIVHDTPNQAAHGAITIEGEAVADDDEFTQVGAGEYGEDELVDDTSFE